jgi:NADH-quinone oxidoreductase subunit G
MSDGDENLAGTALPAHAVVSPATADAAGVADGDDLSVSTARGTITVPVSIGEVPDRVVWLPTNARGCAVRRELGAVAGDIVRLGSVTSPTTAIGGGAR